MRTHPAFILHSMGSDHVLMGEPDASGRRRMIRLNASAAFLWRSVCGKEFSKADLSALLEKEYALSPSEAESDAGNLCSAWLKAGLVLD